jgi:hypothetical protein
MIFPLCGMCRKAGQTDYYAACQQQKDHPGSCRIMARIMRRFPGREVFQIGQSLYRRTYEITKKGMFSTPKAPKYAEYHQEQKYRAGILMERSFALSRYIGQKDEEHQRPMKKPHKLVPYNYLSFIVHFFSLDD